MLKVYAYKGCSTCKNAIKWLKEKGIEHEELAIRETPPSIVELKKMLAARKGELRALFNTSGQDYREMGLKDTLPGMSEAEALKLLSENGNLVKRPFVIDEKKDIALNGFKQPEWDALMA